MTMPPLHDIARVLSYDQETGKFRWLASRGPVHAGAIAGSMLGSYWGLRIFGKTVLAHRVAVLFMTGSWPAAGMTVDHIDGDKLNNCWSNLRVVSQAVNNQNLRGARAKSKSGLIGAHWNKQDNKWQAAIKHCGRSTHLGKFRTAQEAHAAYLSAKRLLHIGCTI